MLSPANDDVRQEVILLSAGVFNLGFIAVKQCPETDRSSYGGEECCLHYAFDEQRNGTFVDQKWINFAPCFFERVHILRDPWANMAYWNLHERKLSGDDGSWTVNDARPLLFFHFSGVLSTACEKISKFTNQYALSDRPDLRLIFDDYRAALVRHGIRNDSGNRHAFGTFATMASRSTASAAQSMPRTWIDSAEKIHFAALAVPYHWTPEWVAQCWQRCEEYLSAPNFKDMFYLLIHGALRTALRIVSQEWIDTRC